MDIQALGALVERFGGWAVVIWIVWWLTKRWETQMGALISTMQKLIEALNKHETSAHERHTSLRDHIDRAFQQRG